MSQNNSPVVRPTGEEAARASKKEAQDTEVEVLGPLHTEHGKTTIEDRVVQKLASIAAREVPGVYAMGNAARRTFNSIAERIPGASANTSGGVSVEKGEQQAAIDVTIVVEYGYSIVDVSEGIRSNIIDSVQQATGLEVLEVNIEVSDVHLPEDDDVEAERSDLK
ncbi:Asp23/Gls24 family envelope stress response protein [Galactobacter valiniphilus]|uniref:Asp23/Gls24 family envelope stress response protein n=1 Tax=Galactobacter valiniphilus TaxID=2676122 RepID=A0A399J8C2_9MICC|nr:Asp23/Gls24 family envelope stress response protein [Galactobacter valiniphilus]RII41330.1 Asp23/Gls24 family envelope stress response protein [Galactobacter valiniphilus]